VRRRARQSTEAFLHVVRSAPRSGNRGPGRDNVQPVTEGSRRDAAAQWFQGPRRAVGHVDGRRAPAGAVPGRPHRLLLPDARLRVRGRGRRAGDVPAGLEGVRAVRGPRRAAVLALPDRDERLPRHAERTPAPCPPHGPRPGLVGQHPPAGPARQAGLDRAHPRRPGSSRGQRPGRARRGARIHPPRFPGGAPASAAEAAGGAHPPRGTPLARVGGGRTARHHGRVSQQRATARCSAHGPRSTPVG
jgi:hypothetical protein